MEPRPPVVLARAPYNPRPGFTLPQLLSALSSLPQSRDTPRPAASSDSSAHAGLRLLVRIENTYVELPIMAITESLVPDGSTVVLMAGEPVATRPSHRTFIVGPWMPLSDGTNRWIFKYGGVTYEITQNPGESMPDLIEAFARRNCDPSTLPR